jgi:hypothetical protein
MGVTRDGFRLGKVRVRAKVRARVRATVGVTPPQAPRAPHVPSVVLVLQYLRYWGCYKGSPGMGSSGAGPIIVVPTKC